MTAYSPSKVAKKVYQKIIKLAQNRLSFFWCHYRKSTYETWMTPEFIDGVDSSLRRIGLPEFNQGSDPDCPYTGFLIAFNWANKITSIEIPYLVKVSNPYHDLFCPETSVNEIYPLGGLDVSGIRMSDAELNCETDLEGSIDLTQAMRKAGLI